MTRRLLDTTVLNNFAQVQRPDLLRLVLGETAATTPTVMAELRDGERLGYVPVCDWAWLSVLKPTAEESDVAEGWETLLDRGEAECLAVAEARGYVFLSDDFAARRLAQQRRVAVSGTIGVLLLLIRGAHLTTVEADVLIAAMIGHGYRSPVQSLKDLLLAEVAVHRVGESVGEGGADARLSEQPGLVGIADE
ncbi:MAG: DUF3368 domain-containing protein [Anaerolineae bacterium]